MWSDLVSLFSGWYASYVSTIRGILEVTNTDADGIVTYTSPEIWSAYVPWEELIAAVVLCVFLISFFKLVRFVLCNLL